MTNSLKTLAWPHSSSPSFLQNWGNGTWMWRRTRQEIEINVRRKVGGMPKIRRREEREWNETKEKRMGNGRHQEMGLTLVWQLYVCVTVLKLHSHSHSGHIEARVFPGSFHGQSHRNVSACLRAFLSVSTISSYYGSSPRKFSVRCPGTRAPERSRMPWVN